MNELIICFFQNDIGKVAVVKANFSFPYIVYVQVDNAIFAKQILGANNFSVWRRELGITFFDLAQLNHQTVAGLNLSLFRPTSSHRNRADQIVSNTNL